MLCCDGSSDQKIIPINLNEKDKIEKDAQNIVLTDYNKALEAEDPDPKDLFSHDYAPTPILGEEDVQSYNIQRQHTD